MADFIPSTDPELIPWLTNLKTKITGYVAALNITPARAAQIIAWCDALIAAINTVAQKKNEWLAASADKQTQMTTSIGGLRGEIAKWKTDAGMTDAISTDLDIVGGTVAFNPDTYKQKLTAQVIGDHVQLKFPIGATDGAIINWRIKGQVAWKFLSRDTNSPYNDHTPLATPGVPEVREYQAFGVLNDEQIGQPSDIVSVTFGG